MQTHAHLGKNNDWTVYRSGWNGRWKLYDQSHSYEATFYSKSAAVQHVKDVERRKEESKESSYSIPYWRHW